MTPRSRSRTSGESNAGRVIAGSARGVRLVGPGQGTRPIGDRVKQALFAILEPTIRGRAFLDLYAGSGAAGIEALSRGASKSVFVDRDRHAASVITRNLEATDLRPRAVVSDWDVGTWLAYESGSTSGSGRREGPFAAILLDPPYEAHWLRNDIEEIAEAGPGAILDGDGIVVAKHFWKTELPGEIGLLRSARRERFGETMLTFYRWADDVASHEVAS